MTKSLKPCFQLRNLSLTMRYLLTPLITCSTRIRIDDISRFLAFSAAVSSMSIVKFKKQSENIMLKALSKSSENEKVITEADIEMFNSFEEETLELKEYEIKTVDKEKDNKN